MRVTPSPCDGGGCSGRVPARPAPKSASVPGSGTAAAWNIRRSRSNVNGAPLEAFVIVKMRMSVAERKKFVGRIFAASDVLSEKLDWIVPRRLFDASKALRVNCAVYVNILPMPAVLRN